MSERTVFTCDRCGRETTLPEKRGLGEQFRVTVIDCGPVMRGMDNNVTKMQICATCTEALRTWLRGDE